MRGRPFSRSKSVTKRALDFGTPEESAVRIPHAARDDVYELIEHARALEAQNRVLFDAHPQPMWIYDTETLAILAVNDSAVRVYGYSRDELLTMSIRDIRPDEDVPVLLDRLAERLPSMTTGTDWRHRRKDGSVFDVEVTGTDFLYNGRAARLVVSNDVTRRRRAEDALAESERRFREMLESVQLIAVVLDNDGHVTFCNDFFLDLIGYTREQAIGVAWCDLCVPEAKREDVRRSFAKIAAGELAVSPNGESEIVARTGEVRLVSWSNTVLRGIDGRVSGMASIGTDLTAQRRAQEQVLHDALHDALTGLPNRALFLERLEGALARAKRHHGYVFAVLFVDLDRFKFINESLGHALGDELLVQAGKILRECVAPDDTVARLGGDEFTLLLDDIGDAVVATRVANRIHERLLAPFSLGGHEVFTTASIGIALSATGYERSEDMLRDADTAMYRAKSRGRAGHEFFDKSMHRRAVAQLSLETDLRWAVERREFSLAYQPMVSLRTGVVAGFEALVRWTHPKRGPVSPAEFIGIAEETGMILPIGRWVLREACEQMKRWTDSVDPRGLPSMPTISVNLSSKQFLDPGLPQEINGLLESTGLDPSRLKLEITESVLMENADGAAAMLRELRGRGIQLSIDDFGTGYSSLSYLLRFPIDTLKIDRTFVNGMADDAPDSAENLELVRTIVTLARNLGMDVVAEGVESEGQRIRLDALGCQYAQGYLFSKPVDAESAWRALLMSVSSPRSRRPSNAPAGE
jgi:diguanylate cyclase (GGDEF)-like protein/PAS domain S-box-containing protein